MRLDQNRTPNSHPMSLRGTRISSRPSTPIPSRTLNFKLRELSNFGVCARALPARPTSTQVQHIAPHLAIKEERRELTRLHSAASCSSPDRGPSCSRRRSRARRMRSRSISRTRSRRAARPRHAARWLRSCARGRRASRQDHHRPRQRLGRRTSTPDLEAVAGATVDLVNLPGSRARTISASPRRLSPGWRPSAARARPSASWPTSRRRAACACRRDRARRSPRRGPAARLRRPVRALGHRPRPTRPPSRSVQLAVRLAAGEAGVWAYDAAFAAVDRRRGLPAEAEAARRLGFIGKTCIHPRQVAAGQRGVPAERSRDRLALRVVEATERASARASAPFWSTAG